MGGLGELDGPIEQLVGSALGGATLIISLIVGAGTGLIALILLIATIRRLGRFIIARSIDRKDAKKQQSNS